MLALLRRWWVNPSQPHITQKIWKSDSVSSIYLSQNLNLCIGAPKLPHINWPSLFHEQPKQICNSSTESFLLRTLLWGAALQLLNCSEILIREVLQMKYMYCYLNDWLLDTLILDNMEVMMVTQWWVSFLLFYLLSYNKNLKMHQVFFSLFFYHSRQKSQWKAIQQ